MKTLHEEAIVIGAGWHPTLFREEAQALLGNTFKIIHSHALMMSKKDANKFSNRSSLVTEVLNPAGFVNLKDAPTISEEISSAFLSLNLPVEKIAVRVDRSGDKPVTWSSREIAGLVGFHLVEAGWPIDLSNPEIVLRIHLLAPSESTSYPDTVNAETVVSWGITIFEGDNWSERTAPNRPFFKPVSLDPKLARAMVNLACPKGKDLLDPFCGTGGLVIESILCGLDSYGSDLAWPMVTGTRQNSEWAQSTMNGTGSFEVRNGSAVELASVWNDIAAFGSFAFDPPYGRNAWKSEDGFDLLKGSLKSCSQVAKENARLVTLIPWSPESIAQPIESGISFGQSWCEVAKAFEAVGWSILSTHEIRVHRSLARLLVIAEKE